MTNTLCATGPLSILHASMLYVHVLHGIITIVCVRVCMGVHHGFIHK